MTLGTGGVDLQDSVTRRIPFITLSSSILCRASNSDSQGGIHDTQEVMAGSPWPTGVILRHTVAGCHVDLRSLFRHDVRMGKWCAGPSVTLAVAGIILVLAACSADAGGGPSASPTSAPTAKADATTPDKSADVPTIARPGGPAPTATPQVRRPSITATAVVVPAPESADSASAGPVAPASMSAPEPVDSPSAGPNATAMLPTSEPPQASTAPQPPGAQLPTPIAATSATPAATPTPALPTPPSAPAAPAANVTRATQFVPLDQPRFVPAAQAQGVTGESLVLGLDWKGESRAYPLSMMWFHHIANDNVNGWPVLVTY